MEWIQECGQRGIRRNTAALLGNPEDEGREMRPCPERRWRQWRWETEQPIRMYCRETASRRKETGDVGGVKSLLEDALITAEWRSTAEMEDGLAGQHWELTYTAQCMLAGVRLVMLSFDGFCFFVCLVFFENTSQGQHPSEWAGKHLKLEKIQTVVQQGGTMIGWGVYVSRIL